MEVKLNVSIIEKGYDQVPDIPKHKLKCNSKSIDNLIALLSSKRTLINPDISEAIINYRTKDDNNKTIEKVQTCPLDIADPRYIIGYVLKGKILDTGYTTNSITIKLEDASEIGEGNLGLDGESVHWEQGIRGKIVYMGSENLDILSEIGSIRDKLREFYE